LPNRLRSTRVILRHQFDWGDARSEIALQRDAEVLVLGAGTVVSEIEGFLNQAVEIDAAAFAGPTTGMLQYLIA
jgi:hypothetical protein